MISLLFLALIGGLSIGGITFIYRQYEDDDNLKKAIAIMIAVMIALTTVFMIFDAKTRDIAFSSNQSAMATLAILLGFTQGGYSPYMKETWGGTGPEQDFDRDGMINMYDEDADNDGIYNYYEYNTQFNPFQPDVGVKDMQVKWQSTTSMIIRAIPVEDINGQGSVVTLYINDKTYDQKNFNYQVDFTIDDCSDVAKIELKVEGSESRYANKANNLISYSLVPGIYGQLGKWYSDMENQLQGWIRNNPLFYAANEFSMLENLLRGAIADVPLFAWVIILTVVVILMFLYFRRKISGKPSLFSRFKRKKKYEEGTTKIEVY